MRRIEMTEREGLPRANGHDIERALHGKTILYCHGNCASPPWRDFLAVIDYVPATDPRTPARSKPLSVLAAIPAFNEGPTIGSVVLRAKQYAEEVVVVDDGSTDDTAEIAALAGAHVIQHARNLGRGRRFAAPGYLPGRDIPRSWCCLTEITSTTRRTS